MLKKCVILKILLKNNQKHRKFNPFCHFCTTKFLKSKMKRFLFFILFTSQFVFSQNVLDKASSLYKKGQYQEAITEYENIFRSKKHSAELYYNLGNCYYKLNKVAPAIYNFEKALLLNPDDAEIQNNLRFAQKRTIDDIKIVAKVGFSKILSDATARYHYNSWAWIAVGFASLFFMFFVLFYFLYKTGYKRLFFTLMIFSFISIIISSVAAYFAKSIFDKDQPAIVFQESIAVKTEPKSASPDSFVLHEGAKVFVIETIDNWKKIELLDGKKGWIIGSSIKMLK
jgi:tetratricopeptide (TPR) repeat protein